MFSSQIRVICLPRPCGSPHFVPSPFPFLSQPYFSVTTSVPSCLSHMPSHTTMTLPPTPTTTSIFPACDNRPKGPDLTVVTTRLPPEPLPPNHGMLDKIYAPITAAETSLLPLFRPPPKPPWSFRDNPSPQISHLGPPDLLTPTILKLVLDPYPPAMLSLVRPPRKPPDKSRTTLKATLLRDLCFYRPPPKPPWMLCWSSALYMTCLMLLFLFLCVVWCYCFCVIVSLLEFCFIMYCFDLCYCFCVVFMMYCFMYYLHVLLYMPKWSLDCRYHIRFVGMYEDESSFTNFAIYQLIFVQRDKVKKSETKCSRNVRDEVEEMIRNWIGKKTLDSHISFVSIRRWKLLLYKLLDYGIWFKSSYLSSKFRWTANPVLTVVFDIRNDLPSNNLGGLAVGCNKSDYTCHINVGDHYNRTFQVGQSWECNAAWSRYFTFGWEVYQEKRDKDHSTIYWSVREDGFYHSLDASHWKLLAQWYSE